MNSETAPRRPRIGPLCEADRPVLEAMLATGRSLEEIAAYAGSTPGKVDAFIRKPFKASHILQWCRDQLNAAKLPTRMLAAIMAILLVVAFATGWALARLKTPELMPGRFTYAPIKDAPFSFSRLDTATGEIEVHVWLSAKSAWIVRKTVPTPNSTPNTKPSEPPKEWNPFD